jgi:hypothetical protein
VGLLSAGSPTVTCPFPALTIIPAFFLASHTLFKIVIILPSVLFFAWNPGLFRREAEVPRRSYVLFGGVVALTIVWFLGSWSYGLHYQGPRYTYEVCAVNFLWAVALGITLLRLWKKESTYGASLVVNWMIFAWLGWYAFPYLGELP